MNEKAIGGSDVCHTCEAHVVAILDLEKERNALAAELAKMIKARELSSEASATLRDESIAKNDRIRALEAALLEGIKAVNGLLARNKDLTAYKAAGDWRESVKTLVVNYGTAEHPCSVPPPAETPEAIHARIVTETADAMAAAPGFCPECLMTGGHKLRCSKAETACGETELAAGCHRSHPHEDMDAGCQRLTEIARENNAKGRT